MTFSNRRAEAPPVPMARSVCAVVFSAGVPAIHNLGTRDAAGFRRRQTGGSPHG